ncbi:MAG TPA: class I SAM-dependent methyltransferase [bacterium]|nr:class I SAM-dependent methyltransferase [bacterium]
MKPTPKSREEFFKDYLEKTPIAMAFWRSLECHRFSKERLEHPVLDVGCGDGFLARVAFGGNLEAGIDLDKAEVERAIASKSYKKALCASATEIPFPKGSFKTVVSNCVLEHIPDLDKALKEIHRVLKPRGRLLITVPSECYSSDTFFRGVLTRMGLKGLGKWYIDNLNKTFKHYHVDDAATWTKRLKKAGFKTVKTDYIIPIPTFHVYERWMILAFPSKILKALFGRWVLGPRGPVKWFASNWLRKSLNADGGKGACYFIAAQKG